MARQFAKSFYNSKTWQNTRELILKRDAYLCIKCGHPAEEVHHVIYLTPDNIMDPMITLNPDNLISLCKDCHFKVHAEDKAKGLRLRKNNDSCEEDFYFDADGFLVKRSEK